MAKNTIRKAKQEIVEVNGQTYVLQHPGLRWYLETVDKNSPPGTTTPKQFLMLEAYLKTVVVDPKVEIEDFEDPEQDRGGLVGVMTLAYECERFLTGTDKQSEDKGESK